ncbi:MULTISPECIES: sigma-70 family RNA polymerase sigma factor [Streptomyces]|uniref:sigma-70 family RNA polymerase sigma factor n=1 Tax=Streptomyces TaxID=1883 RepID=UPI000CD5657A|nr:MULTISPECIES: sigma-70 family RNA polymerase sigma factor [Streptomyces]
MTSSDRYPPSARPEVELPVDLQAFHRMHRPVYVRWAEMQLNSRADAEEAVDQALEEIALTWDEVLRKRNPAGWAWSVMRNRTIDLARARGRRPESVGTEVFDTLALREASDPIAQFEETMSLRQALSRLTERQQDVVILTYYLGYPSHEVAHHLGITAAGARSLARNARRALQELLESGEGEHRDHP